LCFPEGGQSRGLTAFAKSLQQWPRCPYPERGEELGADSLPVVHEQPKEERELLGQGSPARNSFSISAPDCVTWEENESPEHAALDTSLPLGRAPRDVPMLPCYLTCPLGSCWSFCSLQP